MAIADRLLHRRLTSRSASWRRQADPLILPLAAIVERARPRRDLPADPGGEGPDASHLDRARRSPASSARSSWSGTTEDPGPIQVHPRIHRRRAAAAPDLPVRAKTINGARLWVGFGSFQFQPGELAKICLVIFFAAYLAERKELLAIASRKVHELPRAGPQALRPPAGDVGPVACGHVLREGPRLEPSVLLDLPRDALHRDRPIRVSGVRRLLVRRPAHTSAIRPSPTSRTASRSG